MVPLNILIIDDEPRWINFARNNPGLFKIVAVSNIETAVSELAKEKFDLVIASSRHLNTLKVISEKYADQPMVVTTVEPTSQEARNAYRLGARRYFAKSFSYDDLLSQIKPVLPMCSPNQIKSAH
jgi:DNA-binding NtrC family response regulator